MFKKIFLLFILILAFSACSETSDCDNSTVCSAPICIDCAAPPHNCHYDGANCSTCGTLVCDGDQFETANLTS